ncbi:hypothetical protein BD769DRAFT_1637488 [Suillus cothurnatus]|nr:hypothetical protein BD769DRAFT_1637488 [Suillus cothurnatus]
MDAGCGRHHSWTMVLVNFADANWIGWLLPYAYIVRKLMRCDIGKCALDNLFGRTDLEQNLQVLVKVFTALPRCSPHQGKPYNNVVGHRFVSNLNSTLDSSNLEQAPFRCANTLNTSLETIRELVMKYAASVVRREAEGTVVYYTAVQLHEWIPPATTKSTAQTRITHGSRTVAATLDLMLYIEHCIAGNYCSFLKLKAIRVHATVRLLLAAHLTCSTANTSVTNCYDPISVGRPSSDCVTFFHYALIREARVNFRVLILQKDSKPVEELFST